MQEFGGCLSKTLVNTSSLGCWRVHALDKDRVQADVEQDGIQRLLWVDSLIGFVMVI